ncbi:DUF4376 domain-containing protein [Actinobacillus porcinus]|uniref:DUF4376 domain-containing protein n=1 Tax=Actinobacillus porcinus TaxID=51048 RepID=UPI002A914619|nr:DUF4376 domain-containing protein [Actinobacillus porcinus]MDY6216913.1 DUF4376 domain-containing protein [Actinobacillus porcinus]
MYYYDPDKKTFLTEEVNIIPDYALAVTDAEYQKLLIGMTNGCEIIVHENTVLTLTPPKPSNIHEWDGEKWMLDKTKLAELCMQQREQMRQAINTKRDQTDAGGVFVEALGKWVDSDEKAYQNILGVKASLDLLGDMDIPWTWADNSSSIINRTMLAAIVGALLQAKQQNHANALKHKEAMMAVDNPLDYDYSQGWSKTYADYLAEVGNE